MPQIAERINLMARKFPSHLILLVKNKVGYQNLIQLVTRSFLEGFYYKPRADKEILREYSEGLVALSACLKGEIPRLILQNNINEAEELALSYQEIYGKGNFYLEIQNNPMPEQIKVNQELIKLSRSLEIPLVATNDVHYLNKEDFTMIFVTFKLPLILMTRPFKISTDEFYFNTWKNAAAFADILRL